MMHACHFNNYIITSAQQRVSVSLVLGVGLRDAEGRGARVG